MSHGRLDQYGINNGYPTIIHKWSCRLLLNEALNRKMCKNKNVIIFDFTPRKALHVYVRQVFQWKSGKKRWSRADIGNLISYLKSTQKIRKETLVSPMHYFHFLLNIGKLHCALRALKYWPRRLVWPEGPASKNYILAILFSLNLE